MKLKLFQKLVAYLHPQIIVVVLIIPIDSATLSYRVDVVLYNMIDNTNNSGKT